MPIPCNKLIENPWNALWDKRTDWQQTSLLKIFHYLCNSMLILDKGVFLFRKAKLIGWAIITDATVALLWAHYDLLLLYVLFQSTTLLPQSCRTINLLCGQDTSSVHCLQLATAKIWNFPFKVRNTSAYSERISEILVCFHFVIRLLIHKEISL